VDASFNYFGPGVDAQRYSRARPQVHHTAAVEKFRAFAAVKNAFPRALDVGCGTGHSTVALTAVAESVVGIDTSAEMLRNRLLHPKVAYVKAAAESAPFLDRHFDLITVGLAFHWFDAEPFLNEAHRLLGTSGWLVIYNCLFTGEMKEEPSLEGWYRNEFLKRYPAPACKIGGTYDCLTRAQGLRLVGEEPLLNDIEMSLERFVEYELSTTNVVEAVRGGTSFATVDAWMRASLPIVLKDRHWGTFRFAGTIWYLKGSGLT
jgi:SAM-dependent methyltransferase